MYMVIFNFFSSGHFHAVLSYFTLEWYYFVNVILVEHP